MNIKDYVWTEVEENFMIFCNEGSGTIAIKLDRIAAAKLYDELVKFLKTPPVGK